MAVHAEPLPTFGDGLLSPAATRIGPAARYIPSSDGVRSIGQERRFKVSVPTRSRYGKGMR